MIPGEELLIFGYIGVFLIGAAFGMIPFFGPSNMVLAAAVVLLWPVPPAQLLFHAFMIALMISLGVSLAKAVHYYVVILSRRFLSDERRRNLETAKAKVGRWASLAVFLAASTPIPDEPIVYTVGLMKYSWVKFLTSYFSGKMVITLAGAAIAVLIKPQFEELTEGNLLIIISIILTVVLTGILLNWSFEKVSSKTKENDKTESTPKSKEQPKKSKTANTNVPRKDEKDT